MAIEVRRGVTINKPVAEVYSFWRKIENLPRVMVHLKSVTRTEGNHSHWVATAPIGDDVEWDAEMTEERENEILAWRSLPDADVTNQGEIRFNPAPGDRGTELRVRLSYDAPAGRAGVAVASLLGKQPDQQIREDLRRFKQIMEAGETPTTEGQPSGRASKVDAKQPTPDTDASESSDAV